ncbi:MAG: EamA family transporter [Clostridia bacterium]|nr:EamA family transporter [Clostridia bacterium]
MKETAKARLGLIASMVIFGSIGIFRRYIPLPSGMIGACRGLMGALFLFVVSRLRGQKMNVQGLRPSLLKLIFSGIAMGFNWILLFEAYRYTSVATATLCYYMAPVFVILASPFLLKERLTPGKLLCVLAAVAGVALVSGVGEGGSLTGVLLGLGAAVLYATVVLMNKTLSGVSTEDRTMLQLASAGLVLVPYSLLAENLSGVDMTGMSLAMLLVVGAVHTGLAYWLYFGSMKALSGQTVALYSYIDPIVAILLSALILGEALKPLGIVGAVLVLGATLVSERV